LPGFVYSLDWNDRIVVDARLHWVASEAAGAAAVLAGIQAPDAAEWGERIWTDIEERFVDPVGSWHHELDASGRPAGTIWPGKPDLYHAYQAVITAQR
ncbi:MAG TPA: AGE family epimerase/isomerase, partial [Microbacterium sp.]|nr:AGE family epimerase/isomerase [Microbacterium sp.]